MSHSDLLESVERNEGFRATPYLDTEQKFTIGIGRCLETNPLTGEEWKHLLETHQLSVSISKAGADWLMIRQLDATERECQRAFADFWPELDEVRREALVEMAYQMGMERLLGFKKMLAAVRAKDWNAAQIEAIDSRWYRQTPERAKRTARQLATGVRA
jgi:lysozyme